MKEISLPRNGIVPLHEQDYWETHNENLGLPQGTVFDSQSYVRWEAKQKPIVSLEPKK